MALTLSPMLLEKLEESYEVTQPDVEARNLRTPRVANKCAHCGLPWDEGDDDQLVGVWMHTGSIERLHFCRNYRCVGIGLDVRSTDDVGEVVTCESMDETITTCSGKMYKFGGNLFYAVLSIHPPS